MRISTWYQSKGDQGRTIYKQEKYEVWFLDMIQEAGLRVINDEFVRQGFYPSRVLVARNGR